MMGSASGVVVDVGLELIGGRSAANISNPKPARHIPKMQPRIMNQLLRRGLEGVISSALFSINSVEASFALLPIVQHPQLVSADAQARDVQRPG